MSGYLLLHFVVFMIAVQTLRLAVVNAHLCTRREVLDMSHTHPQSAFTQILVPTSRHI